MDVMTGLAGYLDVRKVQTRMCQLGMVSRTGKVGSAPAPVLNPQDFLRIAQASRASLPGNVPGTMNTYILSVAGQPVLQSTFQDYVEPYVEDWPLNFGKTKQGEYERRPCHRAASRIATTDCCH